MRHYCCQRCCSCTLHHYSAHYSLSIIGPQQHRCEFRPLSRSAALDCASQAGPLACCARRCSDTCCACLSFTLLRLQGCQSTYGSMCWMWSPIGTCSSSGRCVLDCLTVPAAKNSCHHHGGPCFKGWVDECRQLRALPGRLVATLSPPDRVLLSSPRGLRVQVTETEGVLTRTFFSDAHKKAAQKVCCSRCLLRCAWEAAALSDVCPGASTGILSALTCAHAIIPTNHPATHPPCECMTDPALDGAGRHDGTH